MGTNSTLNYSTASTKSSNTTNIRSYIQIMLPYDLYIYEGL